MKSIILLSGPIGAGKTTVARELVNISKGPLVYIEGDKFWPFIVKEDKGVKRQEKFRMTMRAMTVAAIPYAMSGYEVILDFSIPPWFLKTAAVIAKRRDVPLNYVVIRPDEKICAERAATRAEGVIADYEPYKEFYSSFDAAQKYIIYDNEGDPAAIADHVREGLAEGLFRISG